MVIPWPRGRTLNHLAGSEPRGKTWNNAGRTWDGHIVVPVLYGRTLNHVAGSELCGRALYHLARPVTMWPDLRLVPYEVRTFITWLKLSLVPQPFAIQALSLISGPERHCGSTCTIWDNLNDGGWTAWYFRPSFVNCCPSNFLSGSTLSPLSVWNGILYTTIHVYNKVCGGGEVLGSWPQTD